MRNVFTRDEYADMREVAAELKAGLKAIQHEAAKENRLTLSIALEAMGEKAETLYSWFDDVLGKTDK
jgi:hypothetical protein